MALTSLHFWPHSSDSGGLISSVFTSWRAQLHLETKAANGILQGQVSHQSATLKARKFKVFPYFTIRWAFRKTKCYPCILMTEHFNYSFLLCTLCKFLITHDHKPLNYIRWPVDYGKSPKLASFHFAFSYRCWVPSPSLIMPIIEKSPNAHHRGHRSRGWWLLPVSSISASPGGQQWLMWHHTAC